ncbi:hypothetical protein vBVpaMR16F_70 [Vibrio phage vB_VpaM_R16F]|nr:hypothetical protein vBVpaMR16F_70 [Vibrio phage vB_VpaM_R16F]
MKNNRKIEIGQVRMISCKNPQDNLLYFIKTFNDDHVYIKEIGTEDNCEYRWAKSDCDYDIVVM